MAPNPQMENTGFELDADKTSLELKGVKVDSVPSPQGQICQPDLCRSLHAKYLQEKSKMGASPWDSLKTRFLVVIIGLLALWVVLYFASSKMGLV